MSVTLTLIPSLIACSMAGTPASVAGILTKTFGRPRRDQSCRARSIDAVVSPASAGSTSIEAKPSRPSAASWTRRSSSAASPTSATAISS
jgi:hypothetical protein